MSETVNNFNKLPKGGKIIMLLIIGALAWWMFGPDLTNNNNSNDSSYVAEKKYSKLSAYTMSQTFVKEKLKSPSTAEFTCDYEKDVNQISDSMFVVNGFVDSQNGFGAMLRSSYRCVVLFKPNDMVSCEGLEIK